MSGGPWSTSEKIAAVVVLALMGAIAGVVLGVWITY